MHCGAVPAGSGGGVAGVEDVELLAENAGVAFGGDGHDVGGGLVGLGSEVVEQGGQGPVEAVGGLGVGDEYAFADDHLVALEVGVVDDLEFTAVLGRRFDVFRVSAEALVEFKGVVELLEGCGAGA